MASAPIRPARRLSRRAAAVALALLIAAPSAMSAGPPDAVALQARQREAMARLAPFDGIWRGPATVTMPGGQQLKLTQTERVGPMLGGTVRLVEGRGHDGSGALAFNALGVFSFDVDAGRYRFRSHAQGHAGDFAIEVLDGAFAWEIPAGPATIRYTASVKDGVWSEIGERVVPGQPPQRIFEMRLQRVGDTTWPAGDAVGP